MSKKFAPFVFNHDFLKSLWTHLTGFQDVNHEIGLHTEIGRPIEKFVNWYELNEKLNDTDKIALQNFKEVKEKGVFKIAAFIECFAGKMKCDDGFIVFMNHFPFTSVHQANYFISLFDNKNHDLLHAYTYALENTKEPLAAHMIKAWKEAKKSSFKKGEFAPHFLLPEENEENTEIIEKIRYLEDFSEKEVLQKIDAIWKTNKKVNVLIQCEKYFDKKQIAYKTRLASAYEEKEEKVYRYSLKLSAEGFRKHFNLDLSQATDLIKFFKGVINPRIEYHFPVNNQSEDTTLCFEAVDEKLIKDIRTSLSKSIEYYINDFLTPEVQKIIQLSRVSSNQDSIEQIKAGLVKKIDNLILASRLESDLPEKSSSLKKHKL